MGDRRYDVRDHFVQVRGMRACVRGVAAFMHVFVVQATEIDPSDASANHMLGLWACVRRETHFRTSRARRGEI